MTKAASGAIALGLFACSMAGAAQAGAPGYFLGGNPNPQSSPGQVQVTATVSDFFQANNQCSVSVVDTTNGNAPICSGPITFTTSGTGFGTGSCLHTFATAGTRTVTGTFTGCSGTVRTYQQVVNPSAIPAPPVAVVPTMTEYGLWGLAGLLLIGGAAVLSRRARRFS